MPGEDQIDWENCLSFRRLFLALHDAGEDASPAIKYMVETARTGLGADSAQCTCGGNVYESVRCVACAFEEIDEVMTDGNGGCPCLYPAAVRLISLLGRDLEARLCQTLRSMFPAAPKGFSELGNTGGPSTAQESSPRLWPNKVDFKLD